MNRKETLIETLRGSVEALEGARDAFEACDIHDETGIVDSDFLIKMLEGLASLKAAECSVMKAINKMLGVSDEQQDTSKGSDTGKKISPEEVLRKCELKDNVVYLPNVQLKKEIYAEVKKRIEEAGGKWAGGKIQGFTFDVNAERVFKLLKEKGRCNLAREFQFFETPKETADWLVSLVGSILPEMKILEPSAGRGSIIKAIHRVCHNVTVDCYELMPENREVLVKLPNIRIIGEDFVTAVVGPYDLIIANPPFSGNQDIRHVSKMYDCLNPGGTLAAITSKHWTFAEEKVCHNFRDWVKYTKGRVIEIEEGTFKESGTGIGTIALVITKQ